MNNMILRRDQSGFRVVNQNNIAGMMFGMTTVNSLKGSLFLFAGAMCSSLETAVQNIHLRSKNAKVVSV